MTNSQFQHTMNAAKNDWLAKDAMQSILLNIAATINDSSESVLAITAEICDARVF